MTAFKEILPIYVVGLILNFACTFTLHKLARCPLHKVAKPLFVLMKTTKKRCHNILWIFISIDYLIAYLEKKQIKYYFKKIKIKTSEEIVLIKSIKTSNCLEIKNKHKLIKILCGKYKLRMFIKKSNCINLALSFMVFLIFGIIDINNTDKCTLFIIVSFFLIRAISRSVEIAYAFTKDVIEIDEKNTMLTSGERIVLGIKSYIEIILNYSVIYYLLSIYQKYNDFFKWFKPWDDLSDLSFALFRSIGISSFTGISASNLDYIAIIQLFSSLSLVIFAFAKYISGLSNRN